MALSSDEKCTRCGEVKTAAEFPDRTGAGKILRPRSCRACRNAADLAKHQRWREANPEKAKARHREYEQRHNESRRNRWHTDPVYRARNVAAAARWKARNRDRVLSDLRARHSAARAKVLHLYGGQCACCAEKTVEFLALDHVEGGGNQARKTESVSCLYKRLAKLDQPDPIYRLLCHNCNSALGFYGYCPHNV